jgi:hypothetical protein
MFAQVALLNHSRFFNISVLDFEILNNFTFMISLCCFFNNVKKTTKEK